MLCGRSGLRFRRRGCLLGGWHSLLRVWAGSRLLSPTKSARRKLRSKRKVTAQAAISFDPAGGELATQSAVIKFKRKRR